MKPKKVREIKIISLTVVMIVILAAFVLLLLVANKTSYIPHAEVVFTLTVDTNNNASYKLILPIPMSSNGSPSLILDHLKAEYGATFYNIIESNISKTVNNRKAIEITAKGKLKIAGSLTVYGENIEIFSKISLANHSKYDLVTVYAYLETEQLKDYVTLNYQIYEKRIYEHSQENIKFSLINVPQTLRNGWQDIRAELLSYSRVE